MSETISATKLAPITLTEGALRELRGIRDQQKVPDDYGLRVGVKGGGCSGFSYILGFDQGLHVVLKE